MAKKGILKVEIIRPDIDETPNCEAMIRPGW